MATIQRINIIGSREGSRNRRRLTANQTGKIFRVGIKSNISTNRNILISGVDRCIHLNVMQKPTISTLFPYTTLFRSCTGPILLGLAALNMLQVRAILNAGRSRSEEHTSELQSQSNNECRLQLDKQKI